MTTQVIEEVEIAELFIRHDTVVFLETREKAAEGRGIQVWSFRAIQRFQHREADAEVVPTQNYVVIVSDPEDEATQDRVRMAFYGRIRPGAR